MMTSLPARLRVRTLASQKTKTAKLSMAKWRLMAILT